jgi:hypothetical protein
VVVRISEEMQLLLTQVARRLLCNKKDVHQAIWDAGVLAYLGLSEEDVETMVVTSLPRGAAATDPKRLAQALTAKR